MSRLTRDGTGEPVSRDQILRHARGQEFINFPCSADHVQDWQPYPVDPYSAICDDHTYMHTYWLCLKSFLFPPCTGSVQGCALSDFLFLFTFPSVQQTTERLASFFGLAMWETTSTIDTTAVGGARPRQDLFSENITKGTAVVSYLCVQSSDSRLQSCSLLRTQRRLL